MKTTLMIMALGMATAAPAALLTVNNASFEDPVLADGAHNGAAPPSWSYAGSANSVVLNPTSSQMDESTLDGSNYAHVNTAGGGFTSVIYQDLSATYIEGYTYTLTVGVARRKDHGANFTDTHAAIRLSKGGTSLANLNIDIADDIPGNEGIFSDYTVSYTATEADAGEAIRIHLWNRAIDFSQDGRGGVVAYASANFDNVRLDAVAGSATLPFSESFENNATNAGSLGPLDGQNGWIADAGAVIQDSIAYGGSSQALQVQNATATHLFSGTASTTNVQVEFHARLTGGAAPESLPANASALFYVAANLHLVAYSNTVPVELAVVVDTKAWTEFKTRCNYAEQTWSLVVDDRLAVDGFPFYTAQTRFAEFAVEDRNAGANYSYYDEIAMAEPLPTDDFDDDGIPDWWETDYYGGPTYADPSATSSNGLNTVMEAYIAGFNPTDPLAGFLISGLTPLASGNILQWDEATGRVYAVYWTSNLLDGFTTALETNLVDGVYTDAVHGAFSEGFYKLEVEIE